MCMQKMKALLNKQLYQYGNLPAKLSAAEIAIDCTSQYPCISGLILYFNFHDRYKHLIKETSHTLYTRFILYYCDAVSSFKLKQPHLTNSVYCIQNSKQQVNE